jgi:Tropinone reductase 1
MIRNSAGSKALNDKWTLAGKNILITGGSKGIGRSIINECGRLGARIITCARKIEDLEETIKEFREIGIHVEGLVADVSTEDGRLLLQSACEEKFGGVLHCLINNVGTNLRKKTTDYSSDDYNFIMKTNLESAFFMTQKLHPYLKASGSGSVVNIGSVAGGCSVAIKSGVVYAMTKAALNQMTYNMACEWASDNIRGNSIKS